MLTDLNDALVSGSCPNYWITEINLLDTLTTDELVTKRNIMKRILENPKRYVADEWLEYSRYVRHKCWYCGNLSFPSDPVEGCSLSCCSKRGAGDNVCCRVPCTYDEEGWKSSKYSVDPLTLDVY